MIRSGLQRLIISFNLLDVFWASDLCICCIVFVLALGDRFMLSLLFLMVNYGWNLEVLTFRVLYGVLFCEPML